MKNKMTVAELMKILSQYDEDAEVEIISTRNEAILDVDFDTIMCDESGW